MTTVVEEVVIYNADEWRAILDDEEIVEVELCPDPDPTVPLVVYVKRLASC